MALNAATTPLVISLTQGSADAFVQGSVLTGLSGRQAYNARTIAIQFTTAAAAGWAVNNTDLQLAVTRRSKTAIPTLADSDVIFLYAHSSSFTTSGLFLFGRTVYFNFPGEMPIVEETLYAQLDSGSTAVVQSAVVKIDVELDTMSDIDRLNLITRSLT